MGNLDKAVRLVIAAVLLLLYLLGELSGTLGPVMVFYAIVLILTSISGISPLYFFIGFSTRNKQEGKKI